MLSSLRTRTSTTLRTLGNVRRYSTPIDVPSEAVPVNPNHGLYAFFRKREKDGKVMHDPYEDESGLHDVFGRAWAAAELRRKSFRDLHTLWYVLLRERNLLATQMVTYRRSTITCRKSMARIKYVINERRLAYEGAMKIHAEKMKQAAKEGEKKVEAERRDSADIMHQEQKVSPPVSETTQAAVDGLLQRSST
ncbi:mitochondrial 39-S ribosomal protein L47 (MRP-L47)-domain-containing protein [Russula vinacea]|nr:mitochondrial 39-S ribosomal protein L47 (MRP-L47)-domain-containing protein [Russula vinacea]